MLVRNHVLYPYSDCEACKRSGDLRIQGYNEKCPYCQGPVEVIIDETHSGRNVYPRPREIIKIC